MPRVVLAWVDIENPPQVQYLLPVARAFGRAGMEVTVTARANSQTVELLDDAGVEFVPAGRSFGRSKVAKAAAVTARSVALMNLLRQNKRPNIAVSSSRPAAITARALRIPSFVICDYEHAELSIYRRTASYLVFPDAIDAAFFQLRGFRPSRLISFPGLKEHITFADVDLDATPEYVFPELTDRQLIRVLVRPPAEESHYFRERSRTVTLELLEHLSTRDDAIVVYSPRYPSQSSYLDSFRWCVKPVLMRRAVPFVSLLKAVDMVVSSGGTMLREAAYLGIPAYSVFQGELGGVDRFLAECGRIVFVRSSADFGKLKFAPATPHIASEAKPNLVNDLVRRMLESAHVGEGPGG